MAIAESAASSEAQTGAAALLPMIKTYLQITWEDGQTDARITGLIEDGIVYIDRLLGEAGDYANPGQPRTLLKEYVRYARDEALDVFENNYIQLINELQNDKRVTDYAVQSAAASGS